MLKDSMGSPESGPSTKENETQLKDILEPHSNDVLSGRGVSKNNWIGNQKFRSIVALNKEVYVTSTKRQKMQISRSVVKAVRSMTPPGRFLERDPKTGLYYDIGDKKAIEKTSQALRDGAATLRKQLSQDLGDPVFLSAVFDPEKESKEQEISETMSLEMEKTEEGREKPKVAKTSHSRIKKTHRRVKSNPDGINHAQKQRAVKHMFLGVPGAPIKAERPVSGMYSPASEPMQGSQSFDGYFAYPGFNSFHESFGYGPSGFMRSSSFDSNWFLGESPDWRVSPVPSKFRPPQSPLRSPGNARASIGSQSPHSYPGVSQAPRADIMIPCLSRNQSWEREESFGPRYSEKQYQIPKSPVTTREFLPPLPPSRRSRYSPSEEKVTDSNDSLTMATADESQDEMNWYYDDHPSDESDDTPLDVEYDTFEISEDLLRMPLAPVGPNDY